tara:strand:+ start:2008 stop:2235 length:228 start_codon:yes stop_codon:yes gene_type:complete
MVGRMREKIWFRPINNGFLDDCCGVSELWLWQTKKGLIEAFPDTKNKEIKVWDDSDIRRFCDEKGISYQNVKIWK